MQPDRTTDASLGELVGQLSTQTSRLVRDEIRLAQKEFQQSVNHAGKGAGLLSAAAVLALLGAGTAIAAIVAALALVLPVWAAAAIVAVVLFVAAGIAALISKKDIEKVAPAAPKAADSIKHDIQEVREAGHRGQH
ncbi:phage holin family protein [Mycolicibacterium mengxianglii]|uniref:phage holin family protein n=1 Tax=Mycolicibacterium mengxianglii TaxID=2736649 RepID=UPI0018D18B8C|nr:phage holin family protein [Mycolicibacterium mengxianglii]